jgi:hypothetical protein
LGLHIERVADKANPYTTVSAGALHKDNSALDVVWDVRLKKFNKFNIL